MIDPTSGVIEQFTPAQPTVAFEASRETAGESCRDPMPAVIALAGTRLGEGFSSALRERIGGALGCSHVMTLALFMDAAVRAGPEVVRRILGHLGLPTAIAPPLPARSPPALTQESFDWA